MKTLKQLALFLLLGSAATLTSCGDDPTTEDPKPTLTVTPSKTTAAPGESVQFKITAAANNKDLKNLNIKLSTNNNAAGQIFDTTFKNTTSTQIDYDYLVAGNNGDKNTFTFTVTDKDGATTTTEQTITVSGSSANVQICSNVTLGAQSSTTGSSFNSSSCAVYKKTEANTNSAMVDLVYFYGSTNLATIAAPNDNSFGTGASQISSIGVQDWATKNATTFKKLAGSFDFSGATDLMAAYNNAGGAEDSKANMLTVGSTYAYKTAAGKYGIFRVKSLNAGQSGTIKIDSKTQK